MAVEDADGARPQRAPVRGSAYYFVLVLATTAGLGVWASRSPAELIDADLIVWVLLIGGIELLPVPATSRIELTVSFPLLVAVTILYPPPVAGLVALLCSLDMGDFDRSTQPIISLFNRAQAALSMVAAGVCFHAFATLDSPLPVLVPATVLAAALLYGVSLGVVAAAMSLNFKLPFLDVLRRGLGAAPLDLVVSYLGLGLFGIVVAKVAVGNGIWSVLVLMGVIVLARHMYFRNTALSNRLSEQNTLLTDQAGQLERLLAEVRDNEERFRSLVQNGSDVITVVLPDSTVTYQTPSVERVLGSEPEELVGSGLVDLLHPDDRAPTAAFLEATARRPGISAFVEWRMRHRDGTWLHVEAIGSNLLADQRVGGIVLTIRSVEERRILTEQLRHQAYHDGLTGLANRVLFRERVGHALGRPGLATSSVAVMFIDLDDFKIVNDSLGHEAGDHLLLTVAERLHTALRPVDTAARLGGDEFAVLLEGIGGAEEATAAARRIVELLRLPVRLAGKEVFVHGSIGIALNASDDTAEDMLRNADLAMYAAKGAGKGTWELFQPSLHAATVERLALNADLQHAIERGQLEVMYQPIVRLDSGRIAGLEALLRWRHPERGLLRPDKFVSLAEESGLIVDIGRWVLEHACRQARQWESVYAPGGPFVSVNISARQLASAELVDQVGELVGRSGLEPSRLVLELTESMLMHDTEAIIERLGALKAVGVRLAIDDFGTGYSSLRYLRRFPVDMLKVGGVFVSGLGGSAEDGALAMAIINLGHTLHLETVAEDVADAEQAARLRALGCQLAQGYFFSEPVEAARVDDLLAGGGAIPAPLEAAAPPRG